MIESNHPQQTALNKRLSIDIYMGGNIKIPSTQIHSGVIQSIKLIKKEMVKCQ